MRALRANPCIVIGTLLAAFALDAPVVAQPVPPQVDPGRVQKQYQPPSPQAEPPAPSIVPSVEPAEAPPGAADVRFVLRSVSVSGSTIYSDEELSFFWQAYVGQEVSVATVFEVAADVTVRYRNDGYVLCRAIVPQQDVTDGNVRLEVVEGYLDEVTLEGEINRPGLWAKRVEQLKDSRPLRASVLERAVLLSNDLPGVSARAVLSPSSAPGASKLTIVVEEKLVDAYADINNRGTRYLGPYQGEFGVTFNSWLDRYESTQLRLVQTPDSELTLLALTHVETLNHLGTTLALSGAYVRTKPGATLDDLNVKGEAESFSIDLSHPFLRSRSFNLSAYGRFDYLDSDNALLGDTVTNDRIRAVRMGGYLDAVDRFEGVNLFRAELSQGIDMLNASCGGSESSRVDADCQFTKLTAAASRLQRIDWGFNVLLSGAAQYAFDPLGAPEQFAFGGDEFGRGYDPSEMLGDHGLAGLLELQYGRVTDWPGLESFQVFASYDYGAVWFRNPLPEGDRRETASSWAVGLRLNFTEWLSGRIMLARPLTRPATVDRDDGFRHTRLFFGITARY